jgi:biopolymer transport protein ExbB
LNFGIPSDFGFRHSDLKNNMWDNSLIQLFDKGGFVMYPLLLCSIIGLAIVLERGIFFLRMRMNVTRFMEELRARLRRGDRKGALDLCRAHHRHPVAHLGGVYLENLNQPDSLRQDILRREGSLQLERVEQRLRGLSVIAHLAPLLGLLGTVTGLVSAFHTIEKLSGIVQPSNLAGGIWEALLTTVFGLVIAIPCMAAYHGFEHEADKISRRMQFAVSELNEFFGKSNGNGGATARRAEVDDETVNAVQ